MSEFEYVGGELDVFARARNWKSYFRSRLARDIRGKVLEVGAGIGGTTQVLCDGSQASWTALEPDPRLAERMKEMFGERRLPLVPEVVVGTLESLSADDLFDTVLYIDVLEHIEDDRAEMVRAAARLRTGGRLIVLCPAHQSLFTPFDKAIGHFRRYDKRMFRKLTPAGTSLFRLFYLDSVGMLLSLANRLLLRSAHPKAAQIDVWDRFFIPCSRVMDPLTGWCVGKTVVGVWERPVGGSHDTRSIREGSRNA